VQKIIAVHSRRVTSTTKKKLTRLRAIFVRARRSHQNTADAKSPYFIECFATLARGARCVAARACDAMMRAMNASSMMRAMHRARRVHTSLSGVSVFFIAL
jgi:hypothetical protein